MFDVVAIGESLIDFVTEGQNSTGMALLSRNPGGAPANVLAMAELHSLARWAGTLSVVS